ncbi:MAG: ParB/RepB/Spo0J family partition protein [Gammaproteobacteria bacterium]|nr:ParB/RepB/Spo0J family partition protein [Gammaproteobacteria bacterium]
MTIKKRGLGRGLDALLGTVAGAHSDDAQVEDQSDLRLLPLDVIQRGKYQPRQDMHPDTLQELADSIRVQGVVQPIVVRPVSAGRYEIIAGERRWRAAQLAGLQDIPAVVRDVPDQAAIAMALIENIQRENLNPLEEANALQRLMREFDMTQQQAAEAVGRSRAAVANLLRLLELDDEVKRLLEGGQLEMGHARALLALSGEAQREAARRVVARGLSVRETEQLVRRLQAPAAGKPAPRRVDPDVRRLQQDLSGNLGATVAIHHTAAGKGTLVIHYTSLEELDGILAHIK